MLIAERRPRTLKWFHAGPLLFGDWGTSRLYVLGLAFFYTAHATPMYLLAMSLIMIGVAWCYTVVCRCFPEGGGVYTSARQISHLLAVVGATLLLCDYIVTAALSTVEAFHYFGTPRGWVVPLSCVAIVLVGIVNWFGARSAGRFALVIAVAALLTSLAIASLCLPFIQSGLRTMSTGHTSIAAPWDRWSSLVHIMLALSGVEAVANMTGMMKEPVERTARRTIWPVLIEVILLNMIFGIALAGLPRFESTIVPDAVTYNALHDPTAQIPAAVTEYKDTAVKQLAIAAGKASFLGEQWGYYFGKAAAVIFGLLLLSATNTAIMAMVSVMYSMAQDREIPRAFSKLNYSGVPLIGLVISVVACVLTVILSAGNTLVLSDMYAVGVCGAITINILCCAWNRELPIGRVARTALWIVGSVMGLVFLTIVATKLHATAFAAGLVALVLTMRWLVARRRRIIEESALPEPPSGWMAELNSLPTTVSVAGPRIMLAARGRDQAEFAVDLAKKRGAMLFAIYVRTLRLIDVAPGQIPRIENDSQAQEALGTVAVIARAAGVAFMPIYLTSPEIAEEILDYTATYGCDTLIMGKSRRPLFSRKLEGDVVQQVGDQLPEGIVLITRAPGAGGH
jgi:amino acid transporter